MEIEENINLAPFTTFRIGGLSKFFCVVKNESEVIEAVKFAQKNKLRIIVIGGGSNLLISDDGFDGLVIKDEIKFPIQAQKETSDKCLVTVGGGEVWDDFVGWTVKNGLFGLENLSAIPGTVGAAPVQNIGAYGTEVGNLIHSIKVLDTSSLEFKDLDAQECRFSYRDSMFKHEKGKYFVVQVVFKLERSGKINFDYKDLKEYFAEKFPAGYAPTLSDIREAIIGIRKNKLPDWTKWGTAGSYFKNPIISVAKTEEIKKMYPGLPCFPDANGQVKISLAWILDKVCHARGIFVNNVGTFEKQALVVVTKPGATSSEVVTFTRDLMEQVKEKIGVEIEAEVEWVV